MLPDAEGQIDPRRSLRKRCRFEMTRHVAPRHDLSPRGTVSASRRLIIGWKGCSRRIRPYSVWKAVDARRWEILRHPWTAFAGNYEWRHIRVIRKTGHEGDDVADFSFP